jgi:hypothetical protein
MSTSEDFKLKLRFFIQYSRAKSLWQCASCRQFSDSENYDRMVINHKQNCKFIALGKEVG